MPHHHAEEPEHLSLDATDLATKLATLVPAALEVLRQALRAEASPPGLELRLKAATCVLRRYFGDGIVQLIPVEDEDDF